MNYALTELDRALLTSVSIPDLALSALPPAKLMQTNSPELLDRPEAPDNAYVTGAVAGGFVLPAAGGEGRIFMPVPPGVDFAVIAFTQKWIVGEIDGDGKFQQVGESYAEKPKDAKWVKNPDTGKKVHKTDAGLLVREEIGVVMLPEATGQVCHYVGRKTATKIVRAFSNRAQRLTVDGIRGCVFGRFKATSYLHTDRESDRSWRLPVFSCTGRLGEERGPTIERVREIAQLRDAYLKGAVLSEPAALNPPAPSASSSSNEAPPHKGYDGPDDGEIDFGGGDFD